MSETADAGGGSTLSALRRGVERLAERDGDYRVACARTGASPVPVDGLRFPDRETAAFAAELARAYRARLRRWNRWTPWHDLVVHERDTVRAPDETRAVRRVARVERERPDRERESG